MRMINNSEDLKGVARKVVWFDQPEQVLGNTQYFLTYVMNYGTDEDLTVVRKYYSDADFEGTLDNPAPGVFFGTHGSSGTSVTTESPCLFCRSGKSLE
jgi:hypothetical protein